MARAIVMPSFGMYTDEGTLVNWVKPAGATVQAGEPVAEIETDKVLAEVPAPDSGVLHHVLEPGAILRVETLIGYVLAPGETPPTQDDPNATSGVPAAAEAASPLSAETAPKPAQTHASPNARRLAAELGVDLSTVTGTGPGGRIGETDVRAALEGRS
jgi:pyruvate/2-oxoglutarate dehydrogenase complex dihydrolipoamide acyltransferase (E2) component